MEPAQVGLALITIGGALLGISVTLAVIGHFRTVKKTVSLPFQYEEKRSFPSTRLSPMPFRLRYDTKIKGKIVPNSGSFSLTLHDYFAAMPFLGSKWRFTSYANLLDMNPGDEQNFEVFMKPGDYILLFSTKSQKAEGSVELAMTSYIRPLRKLIDVGLVLIQVAIPILVTGFVIYVGLPFT